MERLTRPHRSPPPSRDPRGCVGWAVRLGMLFIVLVLFAVTAGLIYSRITGMGELTTVVIGGQPIAVEPNAELSPAERAYLRGYLMLHAADIEESAAPAGAPVFFVVEPGETATGVAERLESAGLIRDATLLRYYLRFYALDAALEAGEFTLRPTMTIPEIAQALSHALADEIELRITEGWRLEQTGDYLAEHREFGIHPNEFLLTAQTQAPLTTEEGGSAYATDAAGAGASSILAALPAEATLEGYLFPDTYRLPADASASDLIRTMLFTFGQRVTPEIRQAIAGQGLTLHGAVTLASIVEREAQLPDERPIIASVFLNRLVQGIRLEADPTVQYAMGYQEATGQWWKRPLLYADLEIDSPYNTYRYAGLPPGPIANPGLSSIEAVAYPAETGYLFFVLDCTAEQAGRHVFAETFEEHQANVERCR